METTVAMAKAITVKAIIQMCFRCNFVFTSVTVAGTKGPSIHLKASR